MGIRYLNRSFVIVGSRHIAELRIAPKQKFNHVIYDQHSYILRKDLHTT